VTTRDLVIAFPHGLGDCVHFAHLLELYRRRGYRVAVNCRSDKTPLFAAARMALTSAPAPRHAWRHPPDFGRLDTCSDWKGSKLLWNFNRAPLPLIGLLDDLWAEYCEVEIDFGPMVTSVHRELAAQFIADLPRPVILLHTHGTSRPGRKNLNRQLVGELYRTLFEQIDGSLVLLDWHNRVPKLRGKRQKHLLDDWGPIGVEELYCLMRAADLLIAVDSGPFQLAQLTDIATLGVWTGHHPSQCTRPRLRTTNLVQSHPVNKALPSAWNLVEYAGSLPKAGEIVANAVRLLRPTESLQVGHSMRPCHAAPMEGVKASP